MPKEQIIMLKAITDESRLRIIKLLEQGERCACVLLENLHFSQPTLSHHMRILCQAGVVQCRREGKWMHYSLSPQGCSQAMLLLGQILPQQPEETENKK